jgi:hypothetical protein
MDRRTSSELHVECKRFAPDWMTVEKANMQLLEKRFAYDLKDIGYEKYDIVLQTRSPFEHPLQNLNRTGVEELARSVKRFLTDQRLHVGEQSVVKFNLDDFPRYAPLTKTFQFLLFRRLLWTSKMSHLPLRSEVNTRFSLSERPHSRRCGGTRTNFCARRRTI